MARVAAETTREATESNVKSLTPSESALEGDVSQLSQRVGELGDELAKMRQRGNFKVQDVIYELVGLRMLLDSTASQLSAIGRPLTAARERLKQHRGRLAPGHMGVEALLASSVSGLVDRVTRLVSNEVASHRARLTDGVSSASQRLKMD